MLNGRVGPPEILAHLRRIAEHGTEEPADLNPESGSEAYWRNEVRDLADRLASLDAPEGSDMWWVIVNAYFAGVAATHLDEWVVIQPTLRRPLMRAAEDALRRSERSAAGARKTAELRTQWEAQALEIAQTLRQDRSIKREALVVELRAALKERGILKAEETLAQKVSRWEKAGDLPRREVD